ncbi:hypothetical protein BDP55DRAFT_302143 [Colletotrichum godetiae]|uniref:Uncharacterized protein n=1 Tax=Colletotrichum godetiae TaxID=1209918 RepID=A0AAJ0AVM7_9PEZI|nr:uncharacterized protein BDP55DRAFT_302143 [Colletotrichum godetiae]KAK1690653.1 hypothetical protein BDP55DRAFT_302143 [Colletotrichum godetiae]
MIIIMTIVDKLTMGRIEIELGTSCWAAIHCVAHLEESCDVPMWNNVIGLTHSCAKPTPIREKANRIAQWNRFCCKKSAPPTC